MKSTPTDRAKAAWLYAQFVTSKTVSLKKSHVGLTIIRDSDIRHESFTERSAELGGLVEFYRSPARVQWTPTGTNVPDYPRLAQLWWQNIGDAAAGSKTPQQAMTALANAQERLLKRLQRAGVLGDCGPKLNEKRSRDYWLAQPGAPKAKLANEKPAPITIDYDELVRSWN
jgi:glycerol transport system substrate-binding protein